MTKNTWIVTCLTGSMMTTLACGSESAMQYDLQVSTLRAGPYADMLTETGLDAETAGQRAVMLLGGTVVEVDIERNRGLEVFEVEVIRSSGSEVEIDLEASTGLVVEIESDDPVAGDDVVPGNGLVPLSEAMRIATARRDGAVMGYELELDEDGTWTWEIDVASSQGQDDIEIEIDARTGEILDEDAGDEPWEAGDDRDDDDQDDRYEDDDDELDDYDDDE